MKKVSINFRLVVMAGILGIAVSCHIDNDVNPVSGNFLSLAEEEKMTKLGMPLENPYSVENMQKALQNLQSPRGKTSGEDIQVMTTHYYVKFMPLNEAELDILKDDTTLILYDYPLDVEIEEGGSYYREPGLPEEQPTPQYCAVEADYVFPTQVEYEILEELFIPDDYSDDASRARKAASEETIDRLVYEAMKLTGNLEQDTLQEKENTTRGTRGLCLFGSCKPKWRPKGTMRVWDKTNAGREVISRVITGYNEEVVMDASPCYNSGDPRPCPSYITVRTPIYGEETTIEYWTPIVDVEVRARRWFTTHTGTTNTEGEYVCNGEFRNPANYSIKWERYHFSIRAGDFGQTILNGPKRTGDWNVDMGSRSDGVDDPHQYYALIYQAARDYYYGNRFGLATPPRNSFWKPQIKIAAKLEARRLFSSEKKHSHAAIYLRYGVVGGAGLGVLLNQLPSIYIREYREHPDEVYAVTAHELAHWAHWDMDRGAFVRLAVGGYLDGQDRDESVIESWAEGVEWRFAIERYRNLYGNFDYSYDTNYQHRTIQGEPIYTSIVVDMIDDCDQRVNKCGTYKVSTYKPKDQVSGYTILQIEQGLSGVRSWNAWRDQIKALHNNSTEVWLDELFGNW